MHGGRKCSCEPFKGGGGESELGEGIGLYKISIINW